MDDKNVEKDNKRINNILGSGKENDLVEETPLGDQEKWEKGLNHLSLDIEKNITRREITLKSVKFGVIVITGAFFMSLGNNLTEKLVLATPYALFGGKNLQIIDGEIYKLKRINQELKSLKR